MPIASIDIYVAAFVARCDARRRPGQVEVDGPGVRGLFSSAEDPITRLLVIPIYQRLRFEAVGRTTRFSCAG